MPVFQYTATAEDGTKRTGSISAETTELAEKVLVRENLVVDDIQAARAKRSPLVITEQRVKLQEIGRFSREMAAFVKAGISLMDGLRVIAGSTRNKRWGSILLNMRDLLSQGVQLSDALAFHNDVLPPYYLGVIRSAELSGKLDIALEQLAEYIERDLDTRRKIKSTLAYPSVVLLMSIVTVGILTVWVLPKFAGFFKGLGAQLPLSTRMLIGIADFSKNFWWVYLLALAVAVATGLYLWRSAKGRRIRSKLARRIPLVRDLITYAVVERLCRVLAALTGAGVPLPDAMSAAILSSNNAVFETALEEARVRMLQGEGLAEPIAATGLFPDAAIEMIRVGEETGTLDQQLEVVANDYARVLDDKLKTLTTLFEPAVILFMGIIVGFVAVALVQAMYGIYQSPGLGTPLK